MADAGQKLNAKQERALVALLRRGEVRAAAAEAGVGETSLWRWLQEEGFQSAYRAPRRQLVESAFAQLQADCSTAARVLREVAEDTDAPASARVSAARAILEQSAQAVEQEELIERVEALEKQAEVKRYGFRR